MSIPKVTVMGAQETVRRVILPDGVGMVEIHVGLSTPDGNPRVRVDVISDQPRYGATATDGLTYVVENGDPGPGVVFLTGRDMTVSRETECANGSPTCTEDDPCIVCYDQETTACEGDRLNVCDDGCGKHINHKVDGDPECGPR